MALQANKQGKMVNYVNWRMRVTLKDGRYMTGQMLAFDKHMNLVLADTEEFRRSKRKATKSAPGSGAADVEEEKRTLGLIILRGTHLISLSVEGPPPADPSARLGTSATTGPVLAAGTGVSRAAVGRGAPISGLSGPALGVGGPAPPGFPPVGFPPAFGRGGPGGPPPFPPAGFPAGGPPNFGPPGGFGGPPGQGRGFQPPPGFGGR